MEIDFGCGLRSGVRRRFGRRSRTHTVWPSSEAGAGASAEPPPNRPAKNPLLCCCSLGWTCKRRLVASILDNIRGLKTEAGVARVITQGSVRLLAMGVARASRWWNKNYFQLLRRHFLRFFVIFLAPWFAPQVHNGTLCILARRRCAPKGRYLHGYLYCAGRKHA